MTLGAWLMVIATWSVVTIFTVRFFWKVLTLPLRADDEPPRATGA